MKPTDFSVLLTKYLSEYLPGHRNVSPNTIRSYSDTFRLFLQFCQECKNISPDKLVMKSLTVDLIYGFLDWIEQGRGCSIVTRNQRLACIHAFVKYAQPNQPENLSELQRILSITSKKSRQNSLSFLSINALNELLKTPDSETKSGRRDLMLLTLLYDTGARVQELIDLSVRDVRTDKPATIVLHGKGRKVRTVPIMEKTNNMLINYLTEQGLFLKPDRLDSPVFSNRQNQRLTRAGVTYILKKHIMSAKERSDSIYPDKVSPHVLRHTKAMHMLQSNINLIYIRDFLGHVNVSTTEIYAKADSETKRKVLEAAYVKAEIPETSNWGNDKKLMEWLKELSK